MHRDEIPIASPCGVDWNGMTFADAKKRFCGECRKHVHDLSRMTRDEAGALLASAATENLCVRYLYDERGQVWFAPEAAPLVAPSRLARMKRFALAAAAVAAPLSLTACMGAAMPPEPQVPPPALTAKMGDVAPPAGAQPAPPPPATANTATPASAAPAPALKTPAPR